MDSQISSFRFWNMSVSSFSPQTFIPAIEHLYIFEDGQLRRRWRDDIECDLWLKLTPFTAVKTLHIPEIRAVTAPTLQQRALEKG